MYNIYIQYAYAYMSICIYVVYLYTIKYDNIYDAYYHYIYRYNLFLFTQSQIYCPPNKHRPSKRPIHFMSLVKRSVCVLPGKACSTTSTWATTSH